MDDMRLNFMDAAKGLLVLCVIIVHLSSRHFFPSYFNAAMESFLIPAFYIIAGYFLKPQSFAAQAKKKANRLLKPFFIIALAHVFIIGVCLIYKYFMHQPIADQIHLLLDRLLGFGLGVCGWTKPLFPNSDVTASCIIIWFLLALFVAILIVNFIIRWNVNRFMRGLAVVGCFAVGYIASKFVWSPYCIFQAMTAASFVYIGYLMNRRKVLDYHYPWYVWGALLLLWLAGIKYGFVNIWPAYNNYDVIPFGPLAAVACGVAVIYFAKYLVRFKTISQGLEFLGRNTLVVLLAECMYCFLPWKLIVTNLISADSFAYYGKVGIPVMIFLWAAVEFMIKLLLCLLLIAFVRRNRFLSTIFGACLASDGPAPNA